LATIIVILAGVLFQLSRTDWCAICVAVALVWMAEAFNTALEFLCDEVSLEMRERIGRAKDVAAFAVLIAALLSVCIGVLTFYPHVHRVLSS